MIRSLLKDRKTIRRSIPVLLALFFLTACGAVDDGQTAARAPQPPFTAAPGQPTRSLEEADAPQTSPFPPEPTPTNPTPTVTPPTPGPYPTLTPAVSSGEPAPAKLADEAPEEAGEAAESADQDLLGEGEAVFSSSCAQCHQEDGAGQPGIIYPALAGNEFVVAEDPAPVIEVVLHGRDGMPAFGDQLSDRETAAVVSYIRSAWQNEASTVREDEVSEQR